VTDHLTLPGYSYVKILEETTSTMDVAREGIGALGTGYGVVVARSQLAGRGRQGRSWISAHGAFMGTFLATWPRARAELAGYSLAVGVAVSDLLTAKYPRRQDRDSATRLSLKWPNDIMVSSSQTHDRTREGGLTAASTPAKKIGGILIEVAEHNGTVVLLIGLGLNLLSAPDQLDTAGAVDEFAAIESALHSSATSTDPFNIVLDLLPDLADGIRAMHTRFIQGGFPLFRDEWLQRSLFVPGTTTLHLDLGDRQVHGTFEGVDPSGALLVRNDSGEVVTISSAHVVSWSGS
jgi:BirA family biotin operon repressor/biotin-[acetyl-CoA-carboxylase] ligase